jgi:hypothetical protein
LAARENGRHQPPEFGNTSMADRVSASMQAVKTPRAKPMLDRGPPDAELQELLVGHDAMLPIRQRSDPPITWSTFWARISPTTSTRSFMAPTFTCNYTRNEAVL